MYGLSSLSQRRPLHFLSASAAKGCVPEHDMPASFIFAGTKKDQPRHTPSKRYMLHFGQDECILGFGIDDEEDYWTLGSVFLQAFYDV